MVIIDLAPFNSFAETRNEPNGNQVVSSFARDLICPLHFLLMRRKRKIYLADIRLDKKVEPFLAIKIN